jgi:hypothetical protein
MLGSRQGHPGSDFLGTGSSLGDDGYGMSETSNGFPIPIRPPLSSETHRPKLPDPGRLRLIFPFMGTACNRHRSIAGAPVCEIVGSPPNIIFVGQFQDGDGVINGKA